MDKFPENLLIYIIGGHFNINVNIGSISIYMHINEYKNCLVGKVRNLRRTTPFFLSILP